jgi:uncharacterized protein YecE (DUF72 family)
MSRESTSEIDWRNWPYRIGCPVWNCKAWKGHVYPNKSRADEALAWYSRMFNNVEGNSTFYGMPSLDVFDVWSKSVPRGFEFCFKFPRFITHETQLDLRLCRQVFDNFLARLMLLKKRDCLGPTFLQLGPSFSSAYRDRLEGFLHTLPTDLPWAVEVRHLDWFDQAANEAWLNNLLFDLAIDRVLFDSRPLYRLPPGDAVEEESQRRKPQSPFRDSVTARAPMVRLIGRNRFEEVVDYWDEWARRIAQWISEGLKPRIFTHAPDDAFAPTLAREMHYRVQNELAKLGSRIQLDELPHIPLADSIKHQPHKSETSTSKQLRLFD